MTIADYTNMREALQVLYDYFNGGGSGLKESKMEKAAARLNRILEVGHWSGPSEFYSRQNLFHPIGCLPENSPQYFHVCESASHLESEIIEPVGWARVPDKVQMGMLTCLSHSYQGVNCCSIYRLCFLLRKHFLWDQPFIIRRVSPQLWRAPTHEVCAEYWRAWDRFNSENAPRVAAKSDRRRRSSDWGEAPDTPAKATVRSFLNYLETWESA